MTKKDYELIASVIANRFNKIDSWKFSAEKHTALTETITIAEDFVNALQAENTRFDKVKFIVYINEKRSGQSKLLI